MTQDTLIPSNVEASASVRPADAAPRAARASFSPTVTQQVFYGLAGSAIVWLAFRLLLTAFFSHGG